MLEKEIEHRVCSYAQTKGFLPYKFTSPNRASVPDRLFVGDNNNMFFIEFKRENGKLTPGQTREIQRLENKGVRVFVVNNVEYGKQLIDTMAEGLSK